MIRTLNIVPYKSVGDLNFGMKRQEVRNIMGEYKEIPQGQFAANSVDSFNNIIDCYYDKYDSLNGVIISNAVNVFLDGKTILPIKEEDFNKMFDDAVSNYADENMTWVKSVGLTSYNYEGYVSTLTVGTNDFYGEIGN